MFDDVRDVEDGSIVGWDVGVVGKEEVATGAAFGFELAEVAGVAVDGKDHVTC